MAPANAKHWKQQTPILVAALLLGLALPVPGSEAPLDACSRGLGLIRRSDGTCLTVLGVLRDRQIKPTIDRNITAKQVGKCCSELQDVITLSGSEDDCACSLRKVLVERDNIELDQACKKLGVTKEKCQAKEDAEKAKAAAAAADAKAKADAAQRREDELSKLGACDRFFERVAAGELSKINRDDDMKACTQEIRTCTASCKVQQ